VRTAAKLLTSKCCPQSEPDVLSAEAARNTKRSIPANGVTKRMLCDLAVRRGATYRTAG